jgi:hypothetical protein
VPVTQRLNPNEGNIEMNPLIPGPLSAGSSKNERNRGGFFNRADHTDASHGRFLDVQGNQTNNRINNNRINVFIGETSRVVQGCPLQ